MRSIHVGFNYWPAAGQHAKTMLKTLIIEDEALAANRLAMLIARYDKRIEVAAKLPSINAALQWFRAHPMPDLVFLDIHLEDGLSIAILKQIPISAPVIFTTAFKDDLLKIHNIDYFACLPKPVNQHDLAAALDSFKQLAL